LINRANALVAESSEREHIYQVAGDIIEALPRRLTLLSLALDRTGLALAKMGEDFLGSRLPLSDKTMVEEAVQATSFGGSQVRHSAAQHLAKRYLAGGWPKMHPLPDSKLPVEKRKALQDLQSLPQWGLGTVEDFDTI
jgi:hypothetical protein